MLFKSTNEETIFSKGENQMSCAITANQNDARETPMTTAASSDLGMDASIFQLQTKDIFSDTLVWLFH